MSRFLEVNRDGKSIINIHTQAIAEEETDPTAVVKIVNLLLGDAAKSLKEHVRDADGIVDVEAIGVEIKEIFESQKDLKN